MIFVLNNIRSAWNVGSAFRTADCLGAQLILCGYTPRPTDANLKLINKTAIGAEKWVKFESYKTFHEVFEKYPNDFHVGAEIDETSTSVYDFITKEQGSADSELEQKELLIWFGNEIHGLEPDLMAQCNKVLHLPMWGKKESLNVSSSLAAMGYLMKYLQVNQKNMSVS
ncbi:MAG: hypothetical protein OHK0017_07050 [Patescibacteria group bacterium]